ncbi:MAG TPA: hypothetical protein P5084_02425 [Paludibacter sp.]|nr:hypothetical protein [Paludibacter sp.]
MNKLIAIKITHTLIWIFMVAVIFYVLYSGIFNQINILTWICITIIILEGFVLMAFKMSCPLTVLARKYSDSKSHNFDIYLPERLAQYNKQIFTTIFLLGLLSVIFRTFY